MAGHPLASYFEIHRYSSRLNIMAATAIWLATALSVWGDGRSLAIVLIGQVVTVAANVWIDKRGLARFGGRIEIARSLFNTTSHMTIAVLVGWPTPVWLWAPYTALAFDRSGGGYSYAVVVVTLASQSIAALVDGVSWIHPVVSGIITVYAWQISGVRLLAIRQMLARSNQQRDEVEHAHASTRAALEQLKAEIATRERIEIELRSAQKLEALGRIASGVAHEINTPIQFVGNSVTFLQEGITEVLSLCQLNLSVRTANDDDTRAVAIAAVDAAEQEADLPYLIENLPQALSRARDGVDRVALIVRSMKQFARSDASGFVHTDLRQAIAATLAIARHEYALVADIETAFDELPDVLCNAGEINQVLLGIVVNAAHAIAGAVASSGRRGTIRIAATHDDDDVLISIADTGTGIAPAIRDRIFDPFFTTKAVGQGTGQGLAIAQAIVERHRGRLTFESELGRGTTFFLRLPIGSAAVYLPARAELAEHRLHS